MSHGVRIFRVDNPHTKPVPFWEWLLKEIRRTDPDVLFLSEAFTKPPMMHTLGAIGFHQSYTYFTWRNARWEIEDYLRELAYASDHLIRPNFFVNTPDILHAFLQYGGPAGVQDPGRAGGDQLAELGRLRRLRAAASTSRSGRAARSTSTRRSTRSGSATGRARSPRAAAWRRTSPGSTRSAATTPPCSGCATS